MVNLVIVCSEFNSDLTNKMLTSALDEAKEHKAKVTKVIRVPGVFEIPLAIKKVIKNKKVNAIIALGVVLKGGTDHDKVIVYTASRKIMDLMIQHEKPIGMGIMGPNITKEQAEQRVEEYSRRAVQTALAMLKI